MVTILYNRVYPKGTAVKNITVGSTEVKYAKRGDGKLFYDTLDYYSYIVPVIISFSYSTNTVVAGGGSTSKPTYSYSQQKIPVGYSGNLYAASTLTSGAKISFEISGVGASIDSQTGVVTWDSRGTDPSNTLRSATVTIIIKINGVLATKTTKVYLEANTFISAIIDVNEGAITAPQTYSAAGNTQTVSNASVASIKTVTLTFASGSTTTSYSNYGSISGPTYKWNENLSYSSIVTNNGASAKIKMDSRGTEHSTSTRSATVTRTATYTFTLSSGYTGFSTSLGSKSCTTTITLAANTISIKSVTVSGGKITAPSTYAAAGATKSVANNIAATASGVLVFASGSEVAASTIYGSWTGPTYKWNENLSYSSIVTNNGAAADVKMDARGTTIGGARSATVTRTASFTFTLKSPYGTSTKSNSGSCTATITQEANIRTLVSVYLSPYLPNSSWIVTVSNNNWDTCPASGGYLIARGYANYTHTSGSELNDLKITDDASLSWSGSSSWITTHTNGGYRVALRGTNYDINTRSSTGTWSYTYDGVTKLATKSITLAKNVIISVLVTSTPGSLTGTTFVAGGETKVTSSEAAGASAKLIFSSEDSLTTYYNTTTYGTWTFHGYSWSSNLTYATVNSTSTYNSLSVTMSNNKSKSLRTAEITRKEKGFTFTLNSSYNNGATSGKSTGTSCKCTVTLNGGTKYYSGYYGTLTTNKPTLAAGTDSATITYGNVFRYYRWNNSTVNSSVYDGTELYSGTVYVTCTESSSYLSGGTGNYTNSSTTTTCELSKSTYGTTVMPSESATLYLRIGSTNGTSIKDITIITNANNKTFKDFFIENYLYPPLSWKKGSIGDWTMLSMATYSWTSGAPDTTETINSTKSFKIISNPYNNFSINSNGRVTATIDNLSDYDQTGIARVTASATVGDITKTATKDTTLVLNKAPYKITINMQAGEGNIYFYFSSIEASACVASTLYSINTAGGNNYAYVPSDSSFDITSGSCTEITITLSQRLYIQQWNPVTGLSGMIGSFFWTPNLHLTATANPITTWL